MFNILPIVQLNNELNEEGFLRRRMDNNTSSSNAIFYLLTFSEVVFLFANKANLA